MTDHLQQTKKIINIIEKFLDRQIDGEEVFTLWEALDIDMEYINKDKSLKKSLNNCWYLISQYNMDFDIREKDISYEMDLRTRIGEQLDQIKTKYRLGEE